MSKDVLLPIEDCALIKRPTVPKAEICLDDNNYKCPASGHYIRFAMRDGKPVCLNTACESHQLLNTLSSREKKVYSN